MNKLFLAIVALLVFSATNYTQAQGFIRGGGGFGIGTGQDAFTTPVLTKDANGSIISANVIYGSFGQGGRFSLAGGYMITPFFGIELEMYYFLGTKQDYGSTSTPSVSNSDYQNRTGYSYQLRAKPSLIIQAPPGAKFQPYARFGILLPLAGQTIIEEKRYIASLDELQETQLNVNGKFSLGFESSVGLRYNISKKLSIYAELTYTGLRIRSQDAEVSKDISTRNGTVTDNLAANIANNQQAQTNIIFQDELTLESNHHSVFALSGKVPREYFYLDGTIDLNKPLNLITQTSNFNSISLSIGIQFTFHKKE